MSTVVPFSPRLAAPVQDEPEHLTGPAKCLGCGHSWIAVTPF